MFQKTYHQQKHQINIAQLSPINNLKLDTFIQNGAVNMVSAYLQCSKTLSLKIHIRKVFILLCVVTVTLLSNT